MQANWMPTYQGMVLLSGLGSLLSLTHGVVAVHLCIASTLHATTSRSACKLDGGPYLLCCVIALQQRDARTLLVFPPPLTFMLNDETTHNSTLCLTPPPVLPALTLACLQLRTKSWI